MAKKKKKVRKANFVSRLQKTPKIKSIKVKIRKAEYIRKKLAHSYKRLIKSESKRLAKKRR
jgi:hypothetical protein